MLRINSHSMNLDLTVMGYIRQGKIACPNCGGEHGAALSDGKQRADRLYGIEARGQHCDSCGTPLVTQQAIISA